MTAVELSCQGLSSVDVTGPSRLLYVMGRKAMLHPNL